MKEKALIYMGVTLFFFFFASIYAICMTKDTEGKKDMRVFCLILAACFVVGIISSTALYSI